MLALISGEWGCGKTYLIKKKFMPSVEDEFACVCVSLFGIDTLDTLRVEVKKKWLEKFSQLNKLNETKVSKFTDSYKRLFGTIKDFLPKEIQKKGEVVSTIFDLVNFVPISNKMYGKKVILVFDDLERSNISSIDLLGCINDYCENQNFNTIIIANEKNIAGNPDGKLSYDKIKEKIVQRFIAFTPDYDDIVSGFIKEINCSITYKGFLRNNTEVLVKILSGDFNDKRIVEQFRNDNYKIDSETKIEQYNEEEEKLKKLLASRPHNIRSFKCAIQDFERVYNKLVEVGIQDCSSWLFSFVCLMMTNKAGLIYKSPQYGNLFRYDNVKKLYPEVFDNDYVLNGFSKWVIDGEWNDEVILKELQLYLEKKKAVTPLEILRTHSLPEVDEKEIDEGFKDLLEEVYLGNLSLDEYVRFLWNCSYSRKYAIDLPLINWEKVREGIRSQIKRLVSSDEKDSHSHLMIGEVDKVNFTEDEWAAYLIIKEFRENDVWVYEKNKKMYIDLISSDLRVAYIKLSNKRYNSFSPEMESATINAYKKAGNKEKVRFKGWFINIWRNCSNSSEIDRQITMKSLKMLRIDLNSLMVEYKEASKNIAATHTKEFIGKLDEIINTEG